MLLTTFGKTPVDLRGENALMSYDFNVVHCLIGRFSKILNEVKAHVKVRGVGYNDFNSIT